MRRLITASLAIILAVTSSNALSRNDRKKYSIEEAYKSQNIADQMEGVKMYFGKQGHPTIQKNLGVFKTNRKTNSFNKSDKEACEWTFFSTLTSLRDRAKAEGGDAVVNIRSNYKNREFSSETEFECGVGNIVSGVALIGTVVKLGKKSSSTGKKTKEKTDVAPKAKGSGSDAASKCSVKKVLDMKKIGMSDKQIEAACGA